MSKLVIFNGKVPTPYMRFFDRNSFDAWLKLQTDAIEIEVSGVNPYTTLYYVDVNLEDKPEYKSINWQSEIGYIKVVPDLESQTFYAFVDRVERNELDENSIRIYYKVDWWDTLLKQGDEPFIVGDVVRAHVNDIVPVDGDEGVPIGVNATLDYTLDTCECDINSFNMSYVENKYPYFGTSKKIGIGVTYTSMLLHVICTSGFFEPLTEPGESPTPLARQLIKDTRILSPLFEIIIPINANGDFVGYYYDGQWKGSAPFGANVMSLKTDNIVGMYVTTEIDEITITHKVLDDGSTPYLNFSSDYFKVAKLSSYHGIEWSVPIRTEIINYSSFYIGNLRSLMLQNKMLNQKDYNRLTYPGYLYSGIIKYYSQIYNPIIISSQNKTVEIDYSFVPGEYEKDPVFILGVNPSSNSFAVYCNSYRYKSNSKYQVGQCNIVAPPPVADKYIDRLTAEQNATKSQINTIVQAGEGAVKTVAATLINPAVGAVTGATVAMDFVKNAAVSSMDIVKSDLVSKGILVSGSLSSGFQACSLGKNFPVIILSHFSDEETLINLAFYGYNTHLQPYEILKNHKRKYFNFIKTSSCNIINIKNTSNGTYRNYSAEVRNDIESMFNGGVWLFNFVSEEDLFNLEVPNYPLSAGY